VVAVGEDDAALVERVEAQVKLDDLAGPQLEGPQGYLACGMQRDLSRGHQNGLIDASVAAADVPHRRGRGVAVGIHGVLADMAGKLVGQRHRLGVGVALNARQPGPAQTQPAGAGPEQVGMPPFGRDRGADPLQRHEVVVVARRPRDVIQPAPPGVGVRHHREQILGD
jgi:hypothetical protein